jgi:uncharacterized membrane protein YczE
MEKNSTLYVVTLLKKMPTLFFGLLLYSIGILATLHSKLGMSPWDVFHMGIVNHSSLSLGQVSQLTGFFILALSYFIGVAPGLGSVFNMIFIGIFIDLIERLNVFSTPNNLIGRILMLLSGIIIIGWASYFYLKVELGAGPRDSLMEGLVKRFNKPVWMIRGAIELTVLLIGYFLGGPVGLGTLIITFTIGFSVQLAFRIGRYDSKSVQHTNLVQMYRNIKARQ